MQTAEYSDFSREIKTLYEACGIPSSPETIEAYWRILRPYKLSEIKARVECALTGLKAGSRPPRPWDLKPTGTEKTGIPVNQDPHLKDVLQRAAERWDEYRLADPINFAIDFNVAITAQKMAALRDSDPLYEDWKLEHLRWRDMKLKSKEEQRRALPTFAREEQMSRSQREEVMRRIRAARAHGVKADKVDLSA